MAPRPSAGPLPVEVSASALEPEDRTERHYTITYGDTGHSYDTIFGPYLPCAKLVLESRIRTFACRIRSPTLCGSVRPSSRPTQFGPLPSSPHDQQTDMAGLQEKFDELKQSLL
jgi:ATP-dependent Lon protease